MESTGEVVADDRREFETVRAPCQEKPSQILAIAVEIKLAAFHVFNQDLEEVVWERVTASGVVAFVK